MPIGNCDCCNRREVPVDFGCDVHGNDVTACYLCKGETDPDPFGEAETDEEGERA
jgi:hypothetical protein